MKTYEINWRDEVHRYMTISAKNKEEAYKIWEAGNYDSKWIGESDCQGLSDKEEIMDNLLEIENA